MSHPGRNRRRALAAIGLVAFALTVVLVGTSSAASAARPKNLVRPTISGTPQVGQTLTGDQGQWTNNPTDFNDDWLRCGPGGGSCAAIVGAHAATYVLVGADEGHTMRFRVRANNGDGTTTAVSQETAVVTSPNQPPPPPPPPPPSAGGCPGGSGGINISSLAQPAILLIDSAQFSPDVLRSGTEDFTGRFHVSACGGRSVQGALVYVTAVPFNQFTIPDEQATGSDGWVSLSFHRLSGYPASSKQQLLALFARARKSGENLLGGISTRRLFSAPVNLH